MKGKTLRLTRSVVPEDSSSRSDGDPEAARRQPGDSPEAAWSQPGLVLARKGVWGQPAGSPELVWCQLGGRQEAVRR